MFRPAQDRLDYGRILKPPVGFECEFAVGTTYSLDLEAMFGVPLALFFTEEMDGALLQNPIYVLEGLRKGADKIALFCEGGQIKVPKTSVVFALLENSVFQVTLQNENSFHPKVWLIKYVDSKGKALYRFVILSRNLTFDRSWDVAVVLEGEVSEQATRKNHPLIDFLRFLQARTTLAAKKERIDALVEELPYVQFQTRDRHFIDFSFFPLGIGKGYDRDSTSLFERYHQLLIISPFLSRATIHDLDALAYAGSHKTLITRRIEIPQLTPELLQSFECYCLKDTIVDGEEAISEDEATAADYQQQDIHAKLYFKTKYSEHTLYIGSANCSHNAWNGNVEFLLGLKYKKWGFRISQVIDQLFGRDKGNFDELHNPFERITVMPPESSKGEDEIEQRLQKAIKILCRSNPRAHVARNNGQYDVIMYFDLKGIDTEIDLTIAALGCEQTVKVQDTTFLNGLSLMELGEFYIVTAGLGEVRLQRIIKIYTLGIPAERNTEIFKSVIKDKNTFLRYMAFLLSDNYLLAILEQEERKKTGTNSWNYEIYDTPVLYENMLKAAAHSPEKFREIDEIVQLVNDRDIIPAEFDRLYTTFLKASRRTNS